MRRFDVQLALDLRPYVVGCLVDPAAVGDPNKQQPGLVSMAATAKVFRYRDCSSECRGMSGTQLCDAGTRICLETFTRLIELPVGN